MTDLADGQSVEVQGSGSSVYTIRNIGGVYSCSCPAWRNQSIAIETRTCKHIRRLRGDDAESARVGSTREAASSRKPSSDSDQSPAAAPVLLAEPWDGILDVSGWWISEKLDGVRAYWDGQQFLSRQGNRYLAPAWFTASLPDQPLDGELWLDRKQFQRTVSIVRRQDQSDHWKQIRYVIFDAPAERHPFEQRLEHLADLLQNVKSEYVSLHAHQLCRNTTHLQEELARVEALGGEGLMLRQPGSQYVAGRSSTLLKVKTFLDAEAEVIGHQPGAGRHKGRLGAVLVRLPDGTEFSVGTGFSDNQRENPPAIGTQITFRYQELSDAGVPRFPSYIGPRLDGVDDPSKQRTRSAGKKSGPTGSSNSAMPVPIPQPKVAGPDPVPSGELQPIPKPGKNSKSNSAVVEPLASSTQTPKSSGKTRHFEYRDEKSDKFWKITVNGPEVTVHYGRNGTKGQNNTKTFPDEPAAQKHADKLIDEKTKSGYVES